MAVLMLRPCPLHFVARAWPSALGCHGQGQDAFGCKYCAADLLTVRTVEIRSCCLYGARQRGLVCVRSVRSVD